jgi:hypothetical protein
MKPFIFVLCMGAMLSTQALAQKTYQCRNANGSVYLSDRPCGGQGGYVYYGPTEPSQQKQTYIPSVGTAPDHLKYMSPRCASMHDAIRTGPARGLKSETLSTMRRDYQAQCAEDEAEARSQLSREKTDQRNEKKAEMRAQANAQNQAKLHEQRCEESKRILVTKRARTDLTEAERAELQRFEANYRSRCS